MKRAFILFISIILFMGCGKKGKDSEQIIKDLDVEYSQIEDVVLSDNGLSYGFMFINNQDRNNIYYVHINGIDYGAFEYLAGPQFSADGTVYGYLYDKEQLSYFNVNGTDFGPYQNGQWLRISEDGSAYGFSYMQNNAWHIRVNDNDYGPYDWAGNFMYFKGSQFSFIFEENAQNHLMVNGTNLMRVENIEDYSVSPDGSEFGYITYKNNAQYLTINEMEYGPYEEVWSPEFSENGDKWACILRRGSEWYVLINGKEKGPYDGISEVAVSPNGNHWGFIYRISWDYFAVVDDQTLGEFSSPSALSFSQDGSVYAFLFRDNGLDWLNMNGEIIGGYDGLGYVFTASNELAICSISNQTIKYELKDI